MSDKTRISDRGGDCSSGDDPGIGDESGYSGTATVVTLTGAIATLVVTVVVVVTVVMRVVISSLAVSLVRGGNHVRQLSIIRRQAIRYREPLTEERAFD